MQLSFRARLLIALMAAALVPVAVLGVLLWATGAGGSGAPGSQIDLVVLFGLILAGFAGAALAVGLETVLLAPLNRVLEGAKQLAEGNRRTPIDAPGEDELGQLAERYNRLAAELDQRDRTLASLRMAISGLTSAASGTSRGTAEQVTAAAVAGAKSAFEMTQVRIVLGDPAATPATPRVPGEPYEVRATIAGDNELLGVVIGTVPPARHWTATDQTTFDLFAAALAMTQAYQSGVTKRSGSQRGLTTATVES